MKIQEYLKKHRLVTDGAMGTYYAKIRNDDYAVCENALITEPETIKQIHIEYLKAGAKLIRTNTFMANQPALKITKEELVCLLKRGCEVARAAISESKCEAFIAGDIGPIPEYAQDEEQDIIVQYKELIDVFLSQNVDAILFETFPEDRYFNELSIYIKEKSPATFVITQFCLNKSGYTSNGIRADKLLLRAARQKEIDAVGFNCGISSGHMVKLISNLHLPPNKYFIISPNAGYPEQMQNRLVYLDNANFFAGNMKKLLDLGVAIAGACCGTTPAYIQGLAKLVEDYPPVAVEDTINESLHNLENKKKPEDKIGGHESAPISVITAGDKTGKMIDMADVDDLNQEDALTKNSTSNNDKKITDLFRQGKKVIAVELDPPFDAEDAKFLECARKLSGINSVDVITIADSPSGRSRIDSILMSVKLMNQTHRKVMPHLCCRDRNMIAMRSALLGAHINGIRNLLLVTGDPVPRDGRTLSSGVFDYNSIRLMEFVKEMNSEHFTKDPYVYGGALNPNGVNIDKIAKRMEKKMEAGASYFLTQPIYSDESIERVHRLREKTGAKILCGIMPFVSYTNACFIKNEFAGILVPDEVVNRYQKDMPREEAELVGANLANELVEKLWEIADGFYFMLPFNRVSLMDKIKIEKPHR